MYESYDIGKYRKAHCNSRALNMMVPLKWSENGETLFSGPFGCAGNGVPMRTLTNKGISGPKYYYN
jgi:hypothetical protein